MATATEFFIRSKESGNFLSGEGEIFTDDLGAARAFSTREAAQAEIRRKTAPLCRKDFSVVTWRGMTRKMSAR